jgi:hypothetical protein
VDAVVHCAARTFVNHSLKDPLPSIQSNILGTHQILEDARRYKVKRFIQVSTDEVYGAITHGAYDESARLNPTNPYSATKAGADCLAIAYAHTVGLHTIITRTENNYGPWQHPQKVFPTFVKALLEGRRLPVYGDGQLAIPVHESRHLGFRNIRVRIEILHPGAHGTVERSPIGPDPGCDRGSAGVYFLEDLGGTIAERCYHPDSRNHHTFSLGKSHDANPVSAPGHPLQDENSRHDWSSRKTVIKKVFAQRHVLGGFRQNAHFPASDPIDKEETHQGRSWQPQASFARPYLRRKA